MLKFIDDNDFLLIDKYKQNEDGSISWVCADGELTHSGIIREGMIRENGDETIDVWAKLQGKIESGEITIEGKSQEEIEAEQIAEFKSSREKLVSESVVTVSTGKSFDAHKDAITNLANSVIKHLGEPDDTVIKWSTADVGTGVMVDCTYAEIKEAHKLAVEYVEAVWGIE